MPSRLKIKDMGVQTLIKCSEVPWLAGEGHLWAPTPGGMPLLAHPFRSQQSSIKSMTRNKLFEKRFRLRLVCDTLGEAAIPTGADLWLAIVLLN